MNYIKLKALVQGLVHQYTRHVIGARAAISRESTIVKYSVYF